MADIPDLDSTVAIVFTSTGKPTKDFYNWLKQVSSFASAWTTYTPTVSANSGTVTSYTSTGTFKQMGKTVFVQIQVTITNAGTAGGNINASLPVAAPTTPTQIITGRESALTGNTLNGVISGSNVAIVYYNNTFPGATGAVLNIGGTYQAA